MSDDIEYEDTIECDPGYCCRRNYRVAIRELVDALGTALDNVSRGDMAQFAELQKAADVYAKHKE